MKEKEVPLPYVSHNTGITYTHLLTSMLDTLLSRFVSSSPTEKQSLAQSNRSPRVKL
jgi:hypothetical protein